MPPIRHSKSTTPSGKKSMHEVNHDPCSVCGLVVRYKCDIARHQRQHAEKKEELMTRCPWPDCEYKSLQRSNVTVHARKQHNWEIHHCRPTCKFSAVLKKDLAQHQQEVHRTKCTTTEWEVEGPIDPDRAPRKPCNKQQKSTKTPDALPSSVSEERAAPLSAASSSSLKERHPHIPTFPCTIRYLEPSSDNTRDAAYMSGGPKYVLDTSNFPAWLVWNQGRMFETLAFPVLPPTVVNPSLLQGQRQQHPAQRQQLQFTYPVTWNMAPVPTQGRGNLVFSFENPSSSIIPTQKIRQQLQMRNHAFKNTIYHPPTVHCPSPIAGQNSSLPVPSKIATSSSVPAQQQLQQPETRDPAIENVLYSRFPLTYTLYKELQAQQQQQQYPVIENTAVPGASAALVSGKGGKLDALSGMEHLISWDDVTSPTADYDNAPLASLNENSGLGLWA
ncbi:hypothetical protein M378DRAFT_14226 [Amanita muscaria Koide BX008]|uniref:C2H2-type domain-containing protein n=1 Tax=Amanita muscaria (strain Koide BX008) TaxID=946122 RepID=A0A0C2T1M7_AMAMK|nr:hypothetical protein M378DRAFT_14226 [Amanita muscaria Koide BX008]